MEEIKVGDVVYLKSNIEVKMTVGYFENENIKVNCDWFNGGTKMSGTFLITSLKIDTSTAKFATG